MTTNCRMVGSNSVSCPHWDRYHVVTEDSEIVCKKCGVVLGMDNLQVSFTESSLNLFTEMEKGTKPVKLECAKRTHEKRSDVSSFSNTCDKLRLPRHCYVEAWNMYSKLRGMTSFSKAEIASYVLYVTCKRYSLPISEEDIQEAIKMTFGVKRMPTMLRVFSRLKPAAQSMGIQKQTKGATDMYYLNLYLTKKERKYGDVVDFGLVRKRTLSIYPVLEGTKESKARRAVQISMEKLERMVSV